MLSPAQFRDEWQAAGDRLVAASAQALRPLGLPPDDARFLVEAGLPADAAPFLWFEALRADPILLVRDQWRLPSTFPAYWSIGSNGSGDPIGLLSTGHVYALNHDDGFSPLLLNVSVRHLAETLLAYREAVHLTLAQAGADAFLEGRIPVAVQVWFRERLRNIDPVACSTVSLWTSELEGWADGAA